MDVFAFAGLALILGFKHSYDADHLIAVANFLRKAQTAASAVRISVSWAIGHMITAAIVTVILYAFRESILKSFLGNFEKVVGIMLIALGFWSLKDLFLHSHRHKHDGVQHEHPHGHNVGKSHVHKHMLGIGIIHGLASNDELLTLFAASLGLTSLAGILVGVAIFSLGVVIGMILFALIFSFPLLKSRSDLLYKAITLTTAAVSVIYGALTLA